MWEVGGNSVIVIQSVKSIVVLLLLKLRTVALTHHIGESGYVNFSVKKVSLKDTGVTLCRHYRQHKAMWLWNCSLLSLDDGTWPEKKATR